MRGTCPHDPLTVAEAIYPGRFLKYTRGHIVIHQERGSSSFVLDCEKGPHVVAIECEAQAFLKWLSELLIMRSTTVSNSAESTASNSSAGTGLILPSQTAADSASSG